MNYRSFTQLINWSKNHYSSLPWRVERSLYGTLVSEIMLQQTTVGTVLNHYERFLKEFPTLKRLASSSEEEICVAWKGLGYYRRARSLRQIAIQVQENFQGNIPTDIENLLSLKGIGLYTAHAIRAIGADQSGLAVDANLERVLARYYGIEIVKGPKLQKNIVDLFLTKKILNNLSSISFRELNEALMDLGRVLCQSRKAECLLCPLKTDCVAYKNKNMLHYPVTKKMDIPKEDLYLKLLRVVVKKSDKILVYKKNENEWLAGQWEIPTFLLETNDPKNSQYPQIKLNKSYYKLPLIKSGITKYKIENYILSLSKAEFDEKFKNLKNVYKYEKYSDKLNLSTTSFKVLRKI